MLKFIKDLFQLFFESDTFQKGASLAYYAVFSFLPLIIIITSVLSLFFGPQAVSGEIYIQFKSALGNDAALQIQDIIKNQHIKHDNVWTTIFGIATLMFSASGMFLQIRNALNTIWEVKAQIKHNFISYFSKHLLAIIILVGLFFIMLISTSINTFLVKYSDSLSYAHRLAYWYEHSLSFLIMGIAFAVMFKYLGDAVIHWKAAFSGGFLTSLLFLFGKIGIGIYLGTSDISTTFGSASVLALLMLWVYYTSQIVFLGAAFVKVMCNRLGHDILPNAHAVKIENIEIIQ